MSEKKPESQDMLELKDVQLENVIGGVDLNADLIGRYKDMMIALQPGNPAESAAQ